jgi:hypothetical protein
MTINKRLTMHPALVVQAKSVVNVHWKHTEKHRTMPELCRVCCAVACCALSCSGGIGQIDHRHLEKADGEIGMLVVKIGGPAYRIGMGGGAASSVPSGSNKADLDFNAVQVRDGCAGLEGFRGVGVPAWVGVQPAVCPLAADQCSAGAGRYNITFAVWERFRVADSVFLVMCICKLGPQNTWGRV